MKTLVITSGGFDPLHAGHISAFERMAKVGDLCVIINSDAWLKVKKEKVFQDSITRGLLIEKLKPVIWVYWNTFEDQDGTVTASIQHILEQAKDKSFWKFKGYDRFVFAKSGDRTSENSPEYEWCLANGVEWLEVESDYPEMHSSKIMEAWQNTDVDRVWGYYKTTVPYQVGNLKFKPKVLVIKPGQSLSLQSHEHREEFWVVVQGNSVWVDGDINTVLMDGDSLWISKNSKHKITNHADQVEAIILEWQVGERVEESDITRYTS